MGSTYSSMAVTWLYSCKLPFVVAVGIWSLPLRDILTLASGPCSSHQTLPITLQGGWVGREGASLGFVAPLLRLLRSSSARDHASHEAPVISMIIQDLWIVRRSPGWLVIVRDPGPVL